MSRPKPAGASAQPHRPAYMVRPCDAVIGAKARGPRRRVLASTEEPSPIYPPGHFTALIVQHDWPPGWQPQYRRTFEVQQSEFARANRERRVALGDTGTIVGLSAKADAGVLARQVLLNAKARR